MKMIVKTDLLIQTLLIVAYGILAVTTGFGGPTLLTGAILMNWQILSSLMMLLFSHKRRVECIVFIAIAIVFQLFINTMFIAAPGWHGSTFVALSRGLPPVLVTCYYIITLFVIFRRPAHKGNFLPHISF